MGEHGALSECEQLVWLAARGLVVFHEDDVEGWRAAILCDGAFGCCGDCEGLSGSMAFEVRKVYERYGWSGVLAWVSESRGREPLEKFRTPRYLMAKELLRYWKEGWD